MPTSAAASTTPSAMQRELEILGKSTEELNALASALENRLGGLLRAQPKLAETATPMEELTPIPNHIRQNRQSVDNASYLLKSILSRLEV
jgi:hypothetical protein